MNALRLYTPRFLLVALASIFLTACTPPAPQVAIRAGIGQSVDLDALRPPSGVTYRFQVDVKDLPLPIELSVTSRRLRNGQYDYAGNYIYTLPSGDGLEEVIRVFRQTLEVEDLNVQVRGNKLLVPYKHRSDNRFRIALTSFQSGTRRTTPHDCFATLGSCQFISEVSGDPRKVRFLADTTEASGIWTTRLRPAPNQGFARQLALQTLTYSLDRNGVPIDLVVQTRLGSNAETTVFRRK